MTTKSISQLDTVATAHDSDLFEVAAVDGNSATGYSSGKMSAAAIAAGMLSAYTYPTEMPAMQNKTITGALNTLLGNFAPAYDSTSTYAVGDIVTYNGGLYKCNTTISVAEAWDSTHWDAGTCKDFFEGGGEVTPQLIACEFDNVLQQKSSYTTSTTFSLQAGDILVCAVSHRKGPVSITGFTTVKTIDYFTSSAGTWSLSILVHIATANETLQPTLTNIESNFMDSTWFQLRNAEVTLAAEYSSSSDTNSDFTITTYTRPFIFFAVHHYASYIKLTDVPQFCYFNNNNGNCILASAININTNTESSAEITFSGTTAYACAVFYIDKEN